MNQADNSDGRKARGASLPALGLFLMIPVFYSLALILEPTGILDAAGLSSVQLIVGALLLALLHGWVRGFPRWVFPYWGFAGLIGLYFQGFTGTVGGESFRGSWLVWTPLLGVAIVGLLWTRDLEPLMRLPVRLWQDWSLLSFAFYGALPLMIVAVYDETPDKWPIVIVNLLLGVGAVLYLRSSTVWSRFACLLGGFILSWGVVMFHLTLYWNGRLEPWMSEPSTWMETLTWTGNMGLALLGILLAPALIEVFRLAIRSRNTFKTA